MPEPSDLDGLWSPDAEPDPFDGFLARPASYVRAEEADGTVRLYYRGVLLYTGPDTGIERVFVPASRPPCG